METDKGQLNGDSALMTDTPTEMHASEAGTNTMTDQQATTNQATPETERDRKASHLSGKDMERPPATGSSSRRPSERSELKPIGIINEQNTCFLNSTFQAVSAVPQGPRYED